MQELTEEKPSSIYIPRLKLFVEVHGRQHFHQATGHLKYINLEKRQQLDAAKKKYAEANGRYMMVDYREHNPELALDRFLEQLEKMI